MTRLEKRQVFRLLILLFFFATTAGALAAEISEEPSLAAYFDAEIAVDKPAGLLFQNHGARIVGNGVRGNALRLGPGEYVTVDTTSIIGERGGTVMFWLRPHWGYYSHKNDAMVSHTFVSFRWSDGGYFVISDGWWEPRGAYYTYFIQDNTNLIHTRPIIKFKKDQWTHIAVTWSTGNNGYVKIYADGEEVGVNRGSLRSKYPSGKLFVGSDGGTPLVNNRWADSDIDDLHVFKKPMSENDIQEFLQQRDPRWKERKYDWMKPILAKGEGFKKDRENNILETRAILDEGPGPWATEAKARETIARIKLAGFNVFLPNVWHGDGTRYPSKVAPPAKYIAPGDALATLIRVAHENGIEVHPWFTVTYRSREFLKEYYDEDTAENSFDIQRPEFRDFIVGLILDVVKRYDVDGINLDYIRTMGIPNSKYAVKAYKNRYGRDLRADQRIFDARGGIEPHMQEFSDEAVEDIVRRISKEARRLKPHLVISVDGHPRSRLLPPSDQGRHEIKWANAGLIDVIYGMSYDRNPDVEGLDVAGEELKDQSKLIMLISNFDYVKGKPVPRDAAAVSDLVTLTQRKWNRGVGVYLYSMLSDEHISVLANGPFKRAAKPNWWKGSSPRATKARD